MRGAIIETCGGESDDRISRSRDDDNRNHVASVGTAHAHRGGGPAQAVNTRTDYFTPHETHLRDYRCTADNINMKKIGNQPGPRCIVPLCCKIH